MPDDRYCIWVDWERHRASLEPVEGYERLPFFSRESWQENLSILTRSGFQIQGERKP